MGASFRVTGRSDDMLIIRGINVYPSQIEAVRVGFPGLVALSPATGRSMASTIAERCMTGEHVGTKTRGRQFLRRAGE